jgi:hypothetical protein
MENDNQNTPETPVVETPAVTPANSDAPATPVVESTAVAIPDGYVNAEEVEAVRTQLASIQTELEAARTEAATQTANARQASIRSVATQLGFNDVADAEKFLSADASDIEGALASVLEAKPYLKKVSITPTSPTNPARTNSALPTFTSAQVSDRAFWNQNKEQILIAMKDGRIIS